MADLEPKPIWSAAASIPQDWQLESDRAIAPRSSPQQERDSLIASPTLVRLAILQNAADAIREFLGIDRVKICEMGSKGQGEVVAESVDENGLPSLLGLRLPAEKSPRAGQNLERDAIGDTSAMNLSNPQVLAAMGIRYSVAVPIFVEERTWGLLVAHHSQTRQHDEREVKLLQAWAWQLGVAIAQNQLLQSASEQEEHEAIAARISSMLNASQTFSERKQAAMEEIAAALNCTGARLYVFPDGRARSAELFLTGDQPQIPYLEETPFWQNFLFDGAVEREQPDWESCPMPSVSPRDRNLSDPSVCAIPDLYGDPQIAALKGAFQTTPIRSLLIVPLRYYQRCVGCLTLFRRSADRDVRWAGQNNPDPRNRLPREALTAWQQASGGLACEWRSAEIKLARVLGSHLYMAVMERRLQETIDHHSNHDRLTGLATRMLFCDRLSLALANRRSQPQALLAVFFLDLDGFKTINDTLGHDVGDRLLQYAANRLVSCLRGGDLVARWGGDEFTILLQGIPSAEKASATALKLLAALSVPFPFNGKNLYVKASLGIALAPYHGEDADTLLKHADAALYRAKQKGRNTYQLYHPAIGSNVQQRLQLEHNLYLALERQEFELYYQPQISLATGKIAGLEALLRWQSPELGRVAPSQFIPLAEETGLIALIGEWALQAACVQRKVWQTLNLPPAPLAVNLSARQFQDKRLLGMVTRVIEETGMRPQQLELEITESIAMQDVEFTVSVLKSLRQLGIKIAIDDFGTGYSSLATLKSFPLDSLKIDRSFVRDLTEDSQDAAIIRAIVALGRGLGLKVIAEGVETAEQLTFLREGGCDLAQGYLLSYPLTADEATQFLRDSPVNPALFP